MHSFHCFSVGYKFRKNFINFQFWKKFYQRSSHHSRVTRLPNHWWASSWDTTTATLCLLAVLDSAGSYNRFVSLGLERWLFNKEKPNLNELKLLHDPKILKIPFFNEKEMKSLPQTPVSCSNILTTWWRKPLIFLT